MVPGGPSGHVSVRTLRRKGSSRLLSVIVYSAEPVGYSATCTLLIGC
jgi:hypothetical protein